MYGKILEELVIGSKVCTLSLTSFNAQVVMAHKFWTQLGSSKHDYNFTFATPTTNKLFDMMPSIETNFLKVGQFPHFPTKVYAWKDILCVKDESMSGSVLQL